MAKIKFIISAILMLLALAQTGPIYRIASGLLQGQTANESYFTGKLAGHLFIAVLLILLSIRLYKDAKKHRKTDR